MKVLSLIEIKNCFHWQHVVKFLKHLLKYHPNKENKNSRNTKKKNKKKTDKQTMKLLTRSVPQQSVHSKKWLRVYSKYPSKCYILALFVKYVNYFL